MKEQRSKFVIPFQSQRRGDTWSRSSALLRRVFPGNPGSPCCQGEDSSPPRGNQANTDFCWGCISRWKQLGPHSHPTITPHYQTHPTKHKPWQFSRAHRLLEWWSDSLHMSSGREVFSSHPAPFWNLSSSTWISFPPVILFRYKD